MHVHTRTVAPEYNVDSSFTVNEGNIFNLSTLNLDANPIPGDGNYSWTFDGQPLAEQPPGVELSVDSFVLNPVMRSQSGVYMITSFNRAGSGQASFALNVNCKYTAGLDTQIVQSQCYYKDLFCRSTHLHSG